MESGGEGEWGETGRNEMQGGRWKEVRAKRIINAKSKDGRRKVATVSPDKKNSVGNGKGERI